MWSVSLGEGPIDGLGLSGGRLLVTSGKKVRAFLPAPEPPTDLALARDGKNGKLTWSAPKVNGSAISAYRIWRRRGSVFTPLAVVNALNYADRLMPGDIGYAVSAIAENAAESERSTEVTLSIKEPLLRRLTVSPARYDTRNGMLTVAFELRDAARISFQIVDAEGILLAEIPPAFMAKGSRELRWNGRTRDGGVVEPGVCRVRVSAEAEGETDLEARAVQVFWDAGPSISGSVAGSTGAASGGKNATGAGAASGSGSGTGTGPADGKSNNGVRDHGEGSGRDGAGQGNGQGKGPGEGK